MDLIDYPGTAASLVVYANGRCGLPEIAPICVASKFMADAALENFHQVFFSHVFIQPHAGH
jgi:hypothetical protein